MCLCKLFAGGLYSTQKPVLYIMAPTAIVVCITILSDSISTDNDDDSDLTTAHATV